MRTMLLLAALALGVSGCTTSILTVPSVQGKAFMVRGAFSKQFWNCDATAGEPTCYQVVETPLPGGK